MTSWEHMSRQERIAEMKALNAELARQREERGEPPNPTFIAESDPGPRDPFVGHAVVPDEVFRLLAETVAAPDDDDDRRMS